MCYLEESDSVFIFQVYELYFNKIVVIIIFFYIYHYIVI